MIISNNCIIPNMNADLYHSDPCADPSLSSSTLIDFVEMTEIEAVMRNKRLFPMCERDDDTEAASLGTIAHDLILRGETGTFEVAPFDDWRKNEAKLQKAEIEAKGLIALNNTTAERIIPKVQAMKTALHEQLAHHLDYPSIMRHGTPETGVFAHDGEIWNRALIDWKEGSPGFEDLIVDYKTTGLRFDQWEKQALWGDSSKYLQSYHYRQTLSLLDKEPHRFVFVVQRTEAPYLVRLIEVDRVYDSEVSARYEQGRGKFINYLRTGRARGELPRVHQSSPPPWVLAKWEMDNAGEVEGKEPKTENPEYMMAG